MITTDTAPAVATGASTEQADDSLYGSRVRRFSAEAAQLEARSNLFSNLRGSSFGIAVICAVWAWAGDSHRLPLLAAAVSLLAFLGFVLLHSRVIHQRDNALRWVRVNQDALARQSDAWRDLPNDGAHFQNPLHPYAADLDLFARGSLFQRLCVAQTLFGQQRLAAYLMNRPEPSEVLRRQAAAQELAPLLEIRQELEALALAVVEPPGAPVAGKPKAKQWLDPEPLLGWAEGAPGFLNNRILVLIASIAPVLTISWITYCVVVQLHPIYWILALVAQSIILLTARNHAARVFASVSTTQGEFLRFGPMLKLLESLPAKAEALKELQRSVESKGGELPSQAMRSFERIVSWFEVRHNGLVYPFINALLLWDIHCVLQLERWQQRSGKALRRWFQALGELEALSSLAAFAADNPHYSWPKLETGPALFEAQGLGHPLLRASARVLNDITIAGPGQGLLVTGSNMSGKSTLLRAMGINVVLALAGAPVCAQRLALVSVAVRTSMRISDSLHQGVSHFYAELRALKSVLDATRGGVPVFFLLDEILHGTNSRERQIGARWVLGELLRRGAMGAVSTHDEGLCELPAPLSSQLRQVHFRETVAGEEMTFDYRLREGPVTSGNALRLMRSMGIDVPLE